ncbi:hypothetical protein, partial [Rahnella sp. BIGb0236]|uniref:hypothetical protein n=1 Tax=Rahnella sp. BIGb0236 TaxID=2485117 RepID=UPI001FBB37F4
MVIRPRQLLTAAVRQFHGHDPVAVRVRVVVAGGLLQRVGLRRQTACGIVFAGGFGFVGGDGAGQLMPAVPDVEGLPAVGGGDAAQAAAGDVEVKLGFTPGRIRGGRQ